MVLGIDHGYGFMKTKNSIFASGVAKFETQPPVSTRVVAYQGNYYQVGCASDGIAGDKTASEDYYILTLAAIAEELKKSHILSAVVSPAVGIPLTRYGAEKEALISYLSRNKKIDYTYEDKEYHIEIHNIYVFPQGYAAIVPMLNSIKGGCNLVDIGTGTIEIVPVTSEHIVDLSRAKTLQYGITNLISSINEAMSRTYQTELSGDQIIDIILGREIVMPDKILELCREEMKSWTANILNLFRQNKINYEFTQTYIMGGGAKIMKEHSGITSECVKYITDIKANAEGYEILAKAMEQKNGGR